MIWKFGMKGCHELQEILGQCGFAVGAIDGIFGRMTEAAVLAFQAKHGLQQDGVVGPRTIDMMDMMLKHSESYMETPEIDTFHEAIGLPALLPQNNLDRRISDAIKLMQTCDDGQGCRYGGWIDAYQFGKDKFKNGDEFPIPKVGRIIPNAGVVKPAHGGTCSPWAGLFLGWYLCVNQDFNFRIGRNARWMATWPHDKVYKGTTIPGYGDYCEVNGKLRLEHHPLNKLYGDWEWLNKINIIEMDHHIVLVLKVGGEDGLHLEDPYNEGVPMKSGLWRLGADGYYPKVNGKKYYSGTKQTLKRINATMRCSQKWDFYRVTDMNEETCNPDAGPWAGRTPRKLVLE